MAGKRKKVNLMCLCGHLKNRHIERYGDVVVTKDACSQCLCYHFERNTLELITCKCGHSKTLHEECGPPIGEAWCTGRSEKYNKKLKAFYKCDCFGYRPDNLIHVEKLAKKKGLI